LVYVFINELREHVQMLALFVRLLRGEDGGAAIDYGLIATLIAVAAVALLRATGANLADLLW
jgi:Flp pilus assembly pilin Flp